MTIARVINLVVLGLASLAISLPAYAGTQDSSDREENLPAVSAAGGEATEVELTAEPHQAPDSPASDETENDQADSKKKKKQEKDKDKDKKKDKDKDDESSICGPPWPLSGDLSGEIEYRYTEVHPISGITEYGRDLGVELAYRMHPLDNWDLHFAFKSGRDNRPTTGWVDPARTTEETWLRPREYWSRHELDLAKDHGVQLQYGAFPYPFDLTQLVFDGDLHMRGAYAESEWDTKSSGNLKRMRLALYGSQLLGGRQPGEGDCRLLSARWEGRFEQKEHTRIDAALSYHEFYNVDTLGVAIADSSWRTGGAAGGGETTNYWDGAGNLESEYQLANAWVEAQWFRESAWPLEIEAEYVLNMGAAGAGNGENQAWVAGVEVGRTGDPGDWRFGIEQVRIESDSVLAAVNRGEYGTNYEGTWVEARYTPAEHLEWRATYGWSNTLFDRGDGLAFDDEELRLYVTISW